MSLSIDASHTLSLETAAFVGTSVAVLGITGSGKTNTAAVLIEELLSQGLPMTIVDIEGEYYGLKQSYDLLIAGRSEHAELEIGPENAPQLAEISIQRGISVILDLSDYTQEETYSFLVAYFTRLWEVAGKEKKPYQIILEEAHEFIPQGTNTPLKQMLVRIALRGRKRGLGIILMSQRSAKVEKDVLTQVPLLFLHKVVHPVDLKVYKDLIPLPGTEVEQTIGQLQKGQAVIMHNHKPTVAQIRLRHTFHAGSTPTLGTTIEPELRHIDTDMLRELQAMLRVPSEKSGNTEARQARRIKELEEIVAARDVEIADLHKQIALLSKLSVAGPDTLEINQATVHKLQVAGKHESHPVVIEAEPTRSKPIQVLAPPLNESKFNSLKRRLDHIPSAHWNILHLLTEKGYSMPTSEIAAWLNLAESTVRGSVPFDLIKLKLIERHKEGYVYVYTSLLRDYLAKEFPGQDVEALIRRLFGEG